MKSYLLCLVLASFSQILLAQRSVFDTLSFENTSHQNRLYFDSTQSNRIWQIGNPKKVLFNSASSGDFAIITDTTLNYSPNTNDLFGFGFEIFGSITTIEFKHRYDLDSLHAFGNIEISVDSGNTWHLLHDTINSFYFLNQVSNNLGSYGTDLFNFYARRDTSTLSNNGFTGTSNGWVTSQIQFPCYAIKRPWEIYLRFNFIADSMAVPAEGWMIDDIIISSFGECSSLINDPLKKKIEVFPNPSFAEELRISEAWDQMVNYRIYSATGQLVQTGQLSAFEQKIALKFSEAGLYRIFFNVDEQLMGSAQLLRP